MENYTVNDISVQEKDEDMARVLVSTVHTSDSIFLLANKLSADRIYLIKDRKPEDDLQEKSVAEIKRTLGKVIEIKEKSVDHLDAVSSATEVVELIDAIPNKDEIYINITSGKKPKALGVLLAAYKRWDRIKKIFYVPWESKNPVILPILPFKVTKSQLRILEEIEDNQNVAELADKLGITRAMAYRSIKALKDMGLIEVAEGKGYQLTDAGRVARL
ncbi:MAG: CRISPR locus-related DNA-binding protein [Candidatus Aenigmarchaeota archaeon]|nr:CRISPR locus-related DNA-binding protein [Candidatus Aenigmarchaeota archaeon]